MKDNGKTFGTGENFATKHRLPNTMGRNGFPALAPGEVFAKFHSNLVRISAPRDGEVQGNAGFTPSQMRELAGLEELRQAGNLKIQPLAGTPIGLFVHRPSQGAVEA